MVLTWPLVGRSAELDFVAAQLADRDSGGVVVAGLPGVGKSRLVREGLARLPRGVPAAFVAGTRAAAEIPFSALAPLLPSPGTSVGATDVGFFQQAVEAVAGRSRGRQLVLGVDDAHLLDAGSCALVRQLVADRKIKVVCTLAAHVSVPDAIVALWKDDLAARLELQPLSLDETTALVEAVLGGTVDSGSMRRLWEIAGGNPLLVKELVDHAQTSGALRFADGAWRSAWPVQGSIWLERILADGLADLSQPERHLLELLAVGEPVERNALLQLRAEAALDALDARGMVVVERQPSGTDAVRLAQAVRAEIVESTLSPLARRERRGELARALLATNIERPDAALRVATLAVDLPDIDLGPELLTKAALAANARWAWDEGERLARAAIEAGAGAIASWALVVAICHGPPSDALAEVAGLAADALDAKHQAMLAAEQVNLLTDNGRFDDARQVMDHALRTIPDPAGCDFVRATWAMSLSTAGDDAEAASIAAPLVSNPSTDELVRLRAAATAMYGWARNGELDRSRAVMSELLPAAFARADELPEAVHWVGGALMLTEVMAGHLDAAEFIAAGGATDTSEERTYDPQEWAALALGRVALLRGDARRASRLLATALAGPAWLVGLEQAWAWALLAEAKALLGDDAGAADAMDRADSAITRGSSRYLCDIERVRPWVAAARGELSAAADLARVAVAHARDRGDRYFELWSTHELVRLGEVREAAPDLLGLAPAIDGEWPKVFSAHVRGLLEGDGDGLLAAADQFEAVGALLHAAEAATEAADALHRAGKTARAAAATARAAALAARCPGAQTPVLQQAAQLPDLSRREQEVALLAAKGLSSSEIGARLFLSRRTVEGHLARAYQKLGVRRRSELVAVLSARAEKPGSPRRGA